MAALVPYQIYTSSESASKPSNTSKERRVHAVILTISHATLTFMNLPNLLTIIRIVLVPVFLLLILSNSLYLATCVFAVAGFTDLIDGVIARRMGSVTTFGKNLDPVADKLLLSSAFIALAFKELMPLWLVIIVVARDSIMITTIIILKKIKHTVNTSPMITGKLTTFFQVISVLCALLFHEFSYAYLLYIFTGVITILSGARYIFREL